MKVLVLGGAGFCGSHIVKRLKELDYIVTVFDNFSRGELSRIDGIADVVINGAVQNYPVVERLIADHHIIINLTCMHMMDTVKDPIGDVSQNILSTVIIAYLCAQLNRKLIHFSSGSVYGSPSGEPVKEDHKFMDGIPTPYTISKAAGDAYIQYFREKDGLKACSLRPYSVYGVHAHNVVNVFTKAILNDETINIHGDGQQIRTFTDVADCVYIVEKIIEREAWGHDFNVAGEEISVMGLAKLIATLSEHELDFAYGETFHGNIDRAHANTDKAEKYLGFVSTPIDVGIMRIIDHYREE
jgi:nucleoside-diphosphate-sugar epimerase